ncbi:uncharacterized protein LOC123688587 [Harmonia axyridis]|uniref:uncharacterized protein LOC123688587 n=1 Tax=Harmonia axyridis TaxID=115357 RepID=UPI001E276472|nr:uncharacterized protein LOC123688587 [Harmonia axyridis]
MNANHICNVTMESEGFTEASSSSATPKRSGSKLSPLTNQRIERMKAKINSLKCKIFRRKVPHCFCKGRPIEATNRTNISRLICESKRYLSKDAHIIFANELKANFVNKFNRRYDDDLKEMCLLWYYASPKGYKALSKSLNLPTVRSLRNWQAKLKISPGISPAIEESLKIHFKNCTDQKRKICILIFDEISLSEEIHYNRATDKVIGVVDTGNIRRNVDLQDENAIYYVSGYMAKKFLKLHPCEKCKSLVVDDEKKLTGQHQLFTYFKQGE